MRLKYGSHSDVGMHRVDNEDVGVSDVELDGAGKLSRGIFVVCDGMGGHRSGAEAAKRASEAFVAAIKADKNATEAGTAADEAVMSIEGKFSDRSPGATLTAMVITQTGVRVVHAGDSEAWVFPARGGFAKITRDHASGWGLDNFCGLGQNFDGFKVDLAEMEIKVGDKFLLATDGLTKHVKASELPDIMRRVATKDLAVHLVELANERGGCDNTTVIAVEVCE